MFSVLRDKAEIARLYINRNEKKVIKYEFGGRGDVI